MGQGGQSSEHFTCEEVTTRGAAVGEEEEEEEEEEEDAAVFRWSARFREYLYPNGRSLAGEPDEAEGEDDRVVASAPGKSNE